MSTSTTPIAGPLRPDFTDGPDGIGRDTGDPPAPGTPLPALRLLSEPALSSPQGSWLPLGRKDAALLCMLAMDGPCARDTLAMMLWPGVGLNKARASLRQRRFRLARSASVPLVEGDEVLRLASGIRHTGTDADNLLASDPAALDADLLQGSSYEDCPGFKAWLGPAREKWRTLRAQALARVASQLEEAGRLAPALSLAQRLAAEAPLSDHVHRRLMRLHYLRGDLGAALGVYSEFAQRLDDELGELPDDETASLAVALRMGSQSAPARSSLPVRLRRPPQRVGNAAQAQAIVQALAEGTTTLIEGAPGIGKTRLLTDLMAGWPAGPRMMVTARVGDAPRPYSVLVRLLRALWMDAGAPAADGHQALPAWARHELAALMPELGNGPPKIEPLRLERAVSEALGQAAVRLVALDDAQNADAATLELLPSLAVAGAPIWLLASRAGELPEVLQAWASGTNAPLHVRLQPLTQAEVHALLQELALPGFEADRWSARLQRYTGGLPLFLLETLRALHERPGEVLHELPAPEAAVQVIRGRAARLSDAARQLAHAVAVLNAPLPLEGAAALLEARPLDLRSPMGELEDVQWVDEQGAMHDIVSAALREAMPAGERRWLHGRVARWLQQEQAPALEVGRHFEAAGLDAEAAAQFEAAALGARRASRPAEEAALWERAGALWERVGPHGGMFTCLAEMISPLSVAKGPELALGHAQRLMNLAMTGAQRARAKCEIGDQLNKLGRPAEASPILLESLVEAEAAELPEVTLRSAICLAQAMLWLGRGEAEVLSLLQGVRSLLEGAGPNARGEFLSVLGHTSLAACRMDESLQAAQEHLAIAEACEDRNNAMMAAGNQSLVLLFAGRIDEAAAACNRALWHRDRLGPTEGSAVAPADHGQGTVCIAEGRLGSAIAAYRRARAHAGERIDGGWELAALYGEADCHIYRGDAATASRLCSRVASRSAGFGPHQFRRAMLDAALARTRGHDPFVELDRARERAIAMKRPQLVIEVESQRCLLADGPSQAAALLEQEHAARVLQQGALATQIAWYRVDALRRHGQAPAAARLARELLEQPLKPMRLLPCHWLWIAQQALAAVDDPLAAEVGVRAQQAHALTLADLGPLSGPRAQWEPPYGR
jgi:DNA-binding SARP family transcriptional activator